MKVHLGALLSVASMGGGELMKFSLEPSYGGGGNASNYKKRPQNDNVEYYVDGKGQLKRRRKHGERE